MRTLAVFILAAVVAVFGWVAVLAVEGISQEAQVDCLLKQAAISSKGVVPTALLWVAATSPSHRKWRKYKPW